MNFPQLSIRDLMAGITWVALILAAFRALSSGTPMYFPASLGAGSMAWFWCRGTTNRAPLLFGLCYMPVALGLLAYGLGLTGDWGVWWSGVLLALLYPTIFGAGLAHRAAVRQLPPEARSTTLNKLVADLMLLTLPILVPMTYWSLAAFFGSLREN